LKKLEVRMTHPLLFQSYDAYIEAHDIELKEKAAKL
jgi:hypothetical protein